MLNKEKEAAFNKDCWSSIYQYSIRAVARLIIPCSIGSLSIFRQMTDILLHSFFSKDHFKAFLKLYVYETNEVCTSLYSNVDHPSIGSLSIFMQITGTLSKTLNNSVLKSYGYLKQTMLAPTFSKDCWSSLYSI